ncbi:MAG: XdhC family protein [Nitritalea sp.]
MLHEIKAILNAYTTFTAAGKRCALATVVDVAGSAYRRPGARMLVAEDGDFAGAISGGCLEGDALKKARTAILKQRPSLLVYDTRQEDTKNFGAGLGCNGLIHVLVEPILRTTPTPIEALQQTLDSPDAVLLCTGYDPQPLAKKHAGTHLPIAANALQIEEVTSILTSSQFIQQEEGQLFISQCEEATLLQRNLRCNLSQHHFFLQYIPKPQRLVVLGAGNDVQLLAQQALLLGWDLLLLDDREYYLRPGRFPEAVQTQLITADTFPYTLLRPEDALLLMSHNFTQEKNFLAALPVQPYRYIGMLGPKKKFVKMLDALRADEVPEDVYQQAAAAYAPIGLQLGAEGPAEIALAVCAEILAVRKQMAPKHLKDIEGPIHKHVLG